MVQGGGKQRRTRGVGQGSELGQLRRPGPSQEALIPTQSCCLIVVGVGGRQSWLERGK